MSSSPPLLPPVSSLWRSRRRHRNLHSPHSQDDTWEEEECSSSNAMRQIATIRTYCLQAHGQKIDCMSRLTPPFATFRMAFCESPGLSIVLDVDHFRVTVLCRDDNRAIEEWQDDPGMCVLCIRVWLDACVHLRMGAVVVRVCISCPIVGGQTAILFSPIKVNKSSACWMQLRKRG